MEMGGIKGMHVVSEFGEIESHNLVQRNHLICHALADMTTGLESWCGEKWSGSRTGWAADMSWWEQWQCLVVKCYLGVELCVPVGVTGDDWMEFWVVGNRFWSRSESENLNTIENKGSVTNWDEYGKLYWTFGRLPWFGRAGLACSGAEHRLGACKDSSREVWGHGLIVVQQRGVPLRK